MAYASSVYIPVDRRHALAQGISLPERTNGAALFTDISGFTPLMEAMARVFGPRRGAEELTRQLNLVYDALITQVDRYGGSVIGFAGDAMTCWFQDPGSTDSPRIAASRAVAAALACQVVMQRFASVVMPDGSAVALAMKASVASGPARRFIVGDPAIQLMDALTGETLARMAAGEQMASKGEVLVDAPTASLLQDCLHCAGWREAEDGGLRFAVVDSLDAEIEAAPWPALSADALSEEQVRVWLLLPVYERLREGLGEFLTELRPAVVLFLRFEGIDYDSDPGAGARLDAFVRWVQTVFSRHEGYLLQLIIGDKGNYLYGAFGAPVAHEDDAHRAVSAALALRTLPSSLDFIRPVQIGISQGTTRAGSYGGTTRRTYGVLGDEVNLAARLMQNAAPGHVLVSQHVQKAVANAFVCESLPPILVKGKSEPVPVARLIGAGKEVSSALYISARSAASKLVGREAELARLRSILEQALAGAGQIVRIEGGTGVGKSRLAAEFAAEADQQGARICIGVCNNIARDVVYVSWRSVFRRLLDLSAESTVGDDAAFNARLLEQVKAAIEPLNPDWRIRLPLLGDLLGLPIPDNATTGAFDPRLRQEALFAFAVELLQICALRQPVLMLIDDAQWMDEASLGLTLALGRVVSGLPALLMLIHRSLAREDKPLLPGLNRLSCYHQIDLGELARDAVADLVTRRLNVPPIGGRLSPLAAALIHARAQGNPFFAEALTDALRESGDLICRTGTWELSDALVNALRAANCLSRSEDTEGGWTLSPDAELAQVAWGIPDSVQAAVLARLDRLPEQPRLTLKVASVVGRMFGRDVLARAHPSRPAPLTLQGYLELCEQRDLIQSESPSPRPAYIFRHTVTQDVVYDTLPDILHRELHQAVGNAEEIVQPDAVERLAYHFGRGGVRYKTLFYLDKAARKAQRTYANETALNYYRQALALEEFWEWRKGQVQVLHILARREEELVALQSLEASPGAPPYEVAYQWAQYYEAVGDYVQAQAAAERALSASQERADRVSEANSLAYLGLIARRQGDYERARSWYRQALTLFQEDVSFSPEEAIAFALALNGLGIVYRQQGNFGEARQCYERALGLSRTSGDRRGEAEALNSLGVTAFYRRSFAEAHGLYQQALALQRAIGDRSGEGTSLYNLAAALTQAGDYGKAQEYFLATLAIQQATGNRWEEVNAWNGLGILYQELGDLLKARDCLSHGLELTRDIGDEAGQAYVLATLGLVARDLGDLDSADNLLGDGLALAQAQDDRYLISILSSYMSTVSLRLNRLTQAIERANKALTLRRETGLRLSTADDLANLAVIYLAAGDLDKATEYARQSMAILDECQGEGPECPQQDYYFCYQVFAAAGAIESASGALRSACRLVMARAEKITDPALRQSFLESVPINREIVQAAHQHALI